MTHAAARSPEIEGRAVFRRSVGAGFQGKLDAQDGSFYQNDPTANQIRRSVNERFTEHQASYTRGNRLQAFPSTWDLPLRRGISTQSRRVRKGTQRRVYLFGGFMGFFTTTPFHPVGEPTSFMFSLIFIAAHKQGFASLPRPLRLALKNENRIADSSLNRTPPAVRETRLSDPPCSRLAGVAGMGKGLCGWNF